ncbi:MAG: hypothetical protein HN337_07535 [Deltaproteobacteria bacterium]|jgi:general secretion pathway protein K|nr:hypothetical protein [Deltaproteobacteria bacterium]
MRSFLKNQRGVALMLVLSAITILTTMIVEFAYNTNVNYNLALNERDRLKAYYLAKSGYSFMLLELKFDKVFRKIVETQNLSQYLGDTAQLPLCQQFPLSTGMIRAVFTGGGLAGLMSGEGGESDGAEGDEELGEKVESMQKRVGAFAEKTAEEFLEFEGDFDGECIDEGTKFNLNGFAGLSKKPAAEGKQSPFDEYKKYFYRFLSKPQYELLFEKSELTETDIIDSIGDWIDSDGDINQFDGRRGGAERSTYDRLDLPYSIRNGRLLTILEAYLIDGVIDTWFSPLQDLFTVYGDGKVNVCIASRDLVESLIFRYIDSNPDFPPVRMEDQEEVDRLYNAVMDGCSQGGSGDQLAGNIESALNTAIGIELPPEEEGGQAEQTQTVAVKFSTFITSETRYFTLKLAGQYMDTTVRIQAVLDIKEDNPKKWKVLYWHIY